MGCVGSVSTKTCEFLKRYPWMQAGCAALKAGVAHTHTQFSSHAIGQPQIMLLNSLADMYCKHDENSGQVNLCIILLRSWDFRWSPENERPNPIRQLSSTPFFQGSYMSKLGVWGIQTPQPVAKLCSPGDIRYGLWWFNTFQDMVSCKLDGLHGKSHQRMINGDTPDLGNLHRRWWWENPIRDHIWALADCGWGLLEVGPQSPAITWHNRIAPSNYFILG